MKGLRHYPVLDSALYLFLFARERITWMMFSMDLLKTILDRTRFTPIQRSQYLA